ncbi:MAG: FAD-dependent oxidoreductase, partial [Clostridia bacterium]|nr:FAD-dependent oxidoreductase [Clostridia bacterium]
MENIMEKANYCLSCKIKPCSVKGCPLNNNIPEFIKCIKEKNYKEAYKILSETTVLPGVCGRICPHTKQCQGSCIRGIKGNPVSIGELEAFTYDMATKEGMTLLDCYKDEIEQNKLNNNKKVAIIGGGPAGLTCSAFLAKAGFKVTIYEKYDYLGGLLVHGIPEFRLSKDIVAKTVKMILDLGVEVKYNHELGKNIILSDLEKEYDAIFLSFGANISSKMGVEGENLKGVYGGNELLEHNLHPNYEGKIVCVIGGGNVAMDCARTVKKLGAKNVKV